MDEILNEVCSSEDLKKFEKLYNEELCKGKISTKTQFEYACFLVRSKYPADVRKGVVLLEDLYSNKSGSGKRDFVYYLAIGNARLEEYSTSLKYIEGLLKVEPTNRQVLEFYNVIKEKQKTKAMKGAAVVTGGLLLGLGAAVGLGIALARKYDIFGDRENDDTSIDLAKIVRVLTRRINDQLFKERDRHEIRAQLALYGVREHLNEAQLKENELRLRFYALVLTYGWSVALADAREHQADSFNIQVSSDLLHGHGASRPRYSNCSRRQANKYRNKN